MVSQGRPGASTIAKAYRLLHAVISTAAADELIVKNPCLIEGGGIERSEERRVITVAEVWALAEEVDPRFRALVLTAASRAFVEVNCWPYPQADRPVTSHRYSR